MQRATIERLRVALTPCLALCLSLLWTAGQASSEELPMANIKASWQAAFVALPPALTGSAPVLGSWRSDTVQGFLAEKSNDIRVPAVIYLHGCSGFGAEGNAYRHFLSLRGYAFFAPDSLARPERRRNCDPSQHAAGLRGSATPLRLAELRYAVSRIAELSWIDHSRVYLIGFSEGAAAAARYNSYAFAGLVLTGWHCHGGPENDGVALPPRLPVLDIISARDPWYPNLNGRTCARFVQGRQNSRSLLLDQETHALLTSDDSEVARISRQAILEFLGEAEVAMRPRRMTEED